MNTLTVKRTATLVELDPDEWDILTCIQHYKHAHGLPPRVRDIGGECNIRNIQLLCSCLDSLEEKGVIRRQRYKARAIHLVPGVTVGIRP